MAKKRSPQRRHSAAFKWEAVQLMHKRLAAGVTLLRIGEELDVRPDLLRRWARAVAGAPPTARVEDVFPGSGHARAFPDAAPTLEASDTPEAELHRLRRENERLRQERDFLKKAAAFFARESR